MYFQVMNAQSEGSCNEILSQNGIYPADIRAEDIQTTLNNSTDLFC